jgi:hypothetical protein
MQPYDASRLAHRAAIGEIAHRLGTFHLETEINRTNVKLTQSRFARKLPPSERSPEQQAAAEQHTALTLYMRLLQAANELERSHQELEAHEQKNHHDQQADAR